MSSEVRTNLSARRAEQSSRWAPWWIYVLVIAPANLGKEQLLPADAAWWLRAALTRPSGGRYRARHGDLSRSS